MGSDLGARLRHVRAGSSQADMASKLGISLRAWASYERNERIPDAELLERLTQDGWDANWLLTGDGDPRSGQGSDREINLEVLTAAFEQMDAMLKTPGFPAISYRGKAELLIALYHEKLRTTAA